MALKSDMIAYQARWAAVEAIQREERRSASLVLRWRQLNAAHGMAKGLGLLQPDLSEMEGLERWAKLKEKANSHPNLDKERIRYWVEQFGEALDLPELWKTISKSL